MLQDLDQLAARIGLLVERTRQLHAERDALRARLSDSELQYRNVQQRCADFEAELQALRSTMAEHGQAADALRAEANQAESTLREQLERESAERQALENQIKAREVEMQTSLQARDSELARLRASALAARERIDAVLSRLPGASVGDQA